MLWTRWGALFLQTFDECCLLQASLAITTENTTDADLSTDTFEVTIASFDAVDANFAAN